MKNFSSRAIASILSAAPLIILTACLNSTDKGSEHEEEQALFVLVRDSSGAAVTADTVHWSYAADPVIAKAGVSAHGGPSDTVRHGATRHAGGGSVWKITEHVHGTLYLRASRDIPHPTDAGCTLSGYAVSHFSADTLSDSVSLTLNVRRVCP